MNCLGVDIGAGLPAAAALRPVTAWRAALEDQHDVIKAVQPPVPASSISMGRGARLWPPPSTLSSITATWPLPACGVEHAVGAAPVDRAFHVSHGSPCALKRMTNVMIPVAYNSRRRAPPRIRVCRSNQELSLFPLYPPPLPPDSPPCVSLDALLAGADRALRVLIQQRQPANPATAEEAARHLSALRKSATLAGLMRVNHMGR